MHKRQASILFSLLIAVSLDAAACHKVSPNPDWTKEYSSVFLGTVTGIHLDGFEQRLLTEHHGRIYDQFFSFLDGSSPVSVDVVSTNVVSGKATSKMTLRLVGCTTSLPSLKERGIFFVREAGQSAVTVWESDTKPFNYWFEKLQLKQDGR